jgi:hypothetical protein
LRAAAWSSTDDDVRVGWGVIKILDRVVDARSLVHPHRTPTLAGNAILDAEESLVAASVAEVGVALTGKSNIVIVALYMCKQVLLNKIRMLVMKR